ncbi:MAG: hypothetical protein WCT05_13335 [Lentisphaeria bacterium]
MAGVAWSSFQDTKGRNAAEDFADAIGGALGKDASVFFFFFFFFAGLSDSGGKAEGLLKGTCEGSAVSDVNNFLKLPLRRDKIPDNKIKSPENSLA